MYGQTGTLSKVYNSLFTQALGTKLRVIVYLFFLSSNTFAQTVFSVHPALTIPLKDGYTLVFLEKEQKANLYRQPRINAEGLVRKIKGYDDNNFSSSRVKISPDGAYLVMENIIKGYVHPSQTDSLLHENYGCVIIDLKKAEVVHYLQSDCDGAWNKNNEWVSNSAIVYRGNDTINADRQLPRLSSNNMASWLNSLKLTPSGHTGSNLILRDFPVNWSVSTYDKKKEITASNTRYIDSLNYLLHKAVNSPNRKYFRADNALRAKIIPTVFKENFVLSDSTVFGVLLLRRGVNSLYSITTAGKVPCKSCENDQYRTMEIWISVSRNKIVGQVLVAYDDGDDILRRMRYYYFDQKHGLLLKDFIIRELSISYKNQEQWQIDAANRVTKLK
ncbi:hypothetical protein [Taibaiella koreensis]|uniref:hypothetical protein n=1 Tax=Taibaiella koreensis TaxID=1268548 RepID=UPI000E59B46B|nr:hypothetical protein [Taibaiella koreensis]